jgi:hypothetical protein
LRLLDFTKLPHVWNLLQFRVRGDVGKWYEWTRRRGLYRRYSRAVSTMISDKSWGTFGAGWVTWQCSKFHYLMKSKLPLKLSLSNLDDSISHSSVRAILFTSSTLFLWFGCNHFQPVSLQLSRHSFPLLQLQLKVSHQPRPIRAFP